MSSSLNALSGNEEYCRASPALLAPLPIPSGGNAYTQYNVGLIRRMLKKSRKKQTHCIPDIEALSSVVIHPNLLEAMPFFFKKKIKIK